MRRIVISAIVVGVAGLVVGYLIFGRISGRYVEISRLMEPPDTVLREIAQSLTGLREARRNVLMSGAVGAAVGLIAGVFTSRRAG